MIEPAAASLSAIPQGIAPGRSNMSLSRMFDVVVFWGVLAIGISVPLAAAIYSALVR